MDPFDPTSKSPQPPRLYPSIRSSGGFSFAYHVTFTGGSGPRADRSITTFSDVGYPSASTSEGQAWSRTTTFGFIDFCQSCSKRSARNMMLAVWQAKSPTMPLPNARQERQVAGTYAGL